MLRSKQLHFLCSILSISSLFNTKATQKTDAANKTEYINAPTQPEVSYPIGFIFLAFLVGLLSGYFCYFLYRRFARHKMIRSLYDSHFDSIANERTSLLNGSNNSTVVPNYSTDPSPDSTANKVLISNPITMSKVNPSEFFLSTLQPLPPLPNLETVNLESEARWQNFYRKKSLAESIIQHATEPPLGRQLRLSVRSCMHLSEVSPEAVAIDQSLQPWENWNLRTPEMSKLTLRSTPNMNQSLRNKLGHRHSKSTASINSGTASIRGNPQDDVYSSHGTVLVSNDSLRSKSNHSKSPSPIPNLNKLKSPQLNKKPEIERLRAQLYNPSLKSAESDSFLNFSSGEKSEVTFSNVLDKATLNKPLKPKIPPGIDFKPRKSSLRIETNFDEATATDQSKAVKFDSSAIDRSVLFGNKDRTTSSDPPPSAGLGKPLLERHFYTDEVVHEWNIANYGKIRFTDHAPMAFRMIRKTFGYSLSDFDQALKAPFGSCTTTAGKSEAIFFLTHNNARFLFKTLRNSEPDNLKQFLPAYLDHIRENPNTLLPRYLGMYTYEKLTSVSKEPPSPGPTAANFSGSGPLGMTSDAAATAAAFPLSQQQALPSSDEAFPAKMIVVVMANLFDTPATIHERYDFKGSNVGRHTLSASTGNLPPTEFERQQDVSHLTLKDLDFQYRVFQGMTNLIHLGFKSKLALLNQLELDLNLLKRFQFMDYSVLIGIHRVPKSNTMPQAPPTTAVGTPTQSIRLSRSGSAASIHRNSPLPSPRTQSTLMQPFLTASNLITSILLPSNVSPHFNDAGQCESKIGGAHEGNVDGNSSEWPPNWAGGVASVRLNNCEVYYIGIIDILQKFTMIKWLEKGIKGYNARLLGGNSTPLFTPNLANLGKVSRDAELPRPGSADSTDLVGAMAINSSNPISSQRKMSLSSSLPTQSPFLNPNGLESAEDLMSISPEQVASEDIVSNLPTKPKGNRLDRLGSTSHPCNHSGTPSIEPKAPQFSSNPYEFSVEEPGRYAERLLEYIRGIVV